MTEPREDVEALNQYIDMEAYDVVSGEVHRALLARLEQTERDLEASELNHEDTAKIANLERQALTDITRREAVNRENEVLLARLVQTERERDEAVLRWYGGDPPDKDRVQELEAALRDLVQAVDAACDFDSLQARDEMWPSHLRSALEHPLARARRALDSGERDA